jgi:predicted transcriptional regulator
VAKWSDLADDMKMLVTIHNEVEAGRPVWFTRLAELLKDDMTKTTISMLEDQLYDMGMIDKQTELCQDGKWGSCYRIESEAQAFVKKVADNVEGGPEIV